jgi:hypothetical protein
MPLKPPYRSGDFRVDCLVWSLLFGASVAVAVARSLEKDDSAISGFGLTLFFINPSASLFQFFWNELHRAVLFAIPGTSFWLLGRRAEAEWSMKSAKRQSQWDV